MSLKIKLRTDDYDVKIRTVQNTVKNFTPRVILEGSEMIEDEIKNQVPVKTGTLLASIRRDTQPLHAVISTNSGYGLFVDEDTKPHVIEAALGGYLRFVINGKVFFRKRVFHTGTKGQQFRRKTLDVVLPRFPDMFVRIWSELQR